jgi:uncharacterized membrane protein
MVMAFENWIEVLGSLVDTAGVGIIIVGIVIATVIFLRQFFRPQQAKSAYKSYREHVGQALLMGLELLVAADIIRTVAIAPTLESVIVLGVIVLIRTFLSWSLEVELNNRWPWQRPSASEDASSADRPA